MKQQRSGRGAGAGAPPARGPRQNAVAANADANQYEAQAAHSQTVPGVTGLYQQVNPFGQFIVRSQDHPGGLPMMHAAYNGYYPGVAVNMSPVGHPQAMMMQMAYQNQQNALLQSGSYMQGLPYQAVNSYGQAVNSYGQPMTFHGQAMLPSSVNPFQGDAQAFASLQNAYLQQAHAMQHQKQSTGTSSPPSSALVGVDDQTKALKKAVSSTKEGRPSTGKVVASQLSPKRIKIDRRTRKHMERVADSNSSSARQAKTGSESAARRTAVGSSEQGSEDGNNGEASGIMPGSEERFLSTPEDLYGGEKRLVIHFTSLGELGQRPQRIGKRNTYVPTGIAGRFKMYHENFRFRIDHGEELVECKDGVKRILITWMVVNEPSGQTTTVLETPQDAMRRCVSGKTICNRVYKEVLERRALSFEEDMKLEKAKREKNEVRLAHIASMIKLFRPKTFSLGPLAFGLLHTVVQEKMTKLAAERPDLQNDN